jgi:hypothetical protein
MSNAWAGRATDRSAAKQTPEKIVPRKMDRFEAIESLRYRFGDILLGTLRIAIQRNSTLNLVTGM